MNAADLKQILTALREAGVVSAEVPTSAGPLRLVFSPEGPLPVGDPTTPGGWKGPTGLDAGYDFGGPA